MSSIATPSVTLTDKSNALLGYVCNFYPVDMLKLELGRLHPDIMIHSGHIDSLFDPKSLLNGDTADGSKYFMNRRVDPPFVPQNVNSKVDVILYVGEEGALLTSIMLTYKNTPLFSFSPKNKIGQRQGFQVNRSLMRR